MAFPNDIISGGLISVETKQYPEKARAVVFDIDCSELDTEHYRFFKQNDSSSPHYVVRQKKNHLFLEVVF